MSPETILLNHGVRLKSYGPGRHYTTCPKCSRDRSSAAHRRAHVLGVSIEADGSVKFGCNHCAWTGPEKGKGNGADGPPLTTHVYRDQDGARRFRKVRNSPGRTPRFWLEKWDGAGWAKGTDGVDTSIVYRANEVAQAIKDGRVIAVAEGEKDVDRLWSIGVAATCNAHGASESGKAPKWRRSHSEQLRGADIVVLNDNDNDNAGFAHADTTCKLSLGVAKRVRRLDLKLHWPDMPKGADVSDWLDQGHTRAELDALIAEAPDYATEDRRPPPADRRRAWMSGASRDDRGRVLPTLANLMLALRAAPEIADAFRFDEMTRAPLLTRPLPAVERAEGELGPYPRPVRDTDVSQLQEWLQREGLLKIGQEVTHQAVDLRAQERSFHPVRDYLTGLVWDKTSRLNRWLSYYLGADPSEYVAAVGSMFLIAMVARIFEPGCKADYMLVLEGDQGDLKSSACQILAGQWFSDSLPDVLLDKDAAQHISGEWLIEIGELSAISRAESEHLKTFITRQVERYRPSYGRKEVHQPRQCVFVGTTNRSVYLKDETGGRRFWPVRLSQIDLDALRHDRDQLFAEAVVRYRAGDRWWPERDFERVRIKPQQDNRFEGDVWEDAVAAHVANLSRVSVSDVARLALGMESARIGTREQRRIAGILVGLGWKPTRDWQGRAYVRDHDA